jgi:endonuclease/exonuclease/phosphatase family metal-dependent hydrolase
MKILTFNLWHGMGQTRFGMRSMEAPGRSSDRLYGFLTLAREARPDLIFLQEANPVPKIAPRVAAALDMDEIHQTSNAGMKLVVGVPPSFWSGIVILARKGLGLGKLDVFKLPGSGWGWCGDRFSFQFQEHRYALFGRLEWNGTPLVLACTHLHHTRPLDPQAQERLKDAVKTGVLSSEALENLLAHFENRIARRGRQVEAIVFRLRKIAPGLRVILCGDFNAEPDSGEIRSLVTAHGFIDTYAEAGAPPGFTWNPEGNGNTAMSQGAFPDTYPSNPEIHSLLEQQDMRPGRIDYVFLNRTFTPGQVVASELFADRPFSGGMFCSDHFGVLTTLRF